MKHSYIFLIVLLFAIFHAPKVCSQTKRAVVIGIGEYDDPYWSQIHGDRDVPIVKDMLTNCGYNDLVTLVNAQATKRNIENTLLSLIHRCRKGDLIYIHFSGHGQLITDVNGDEDDGWDEAWIPYDAQFFYSNTYKGENHLVDDEIANYLQKIKQKIGNSGQLLVVVDACHSGDSSRGKSCEDVCKRGTDDKFVIPLKLRPRKSAKIQERWLTLTACKDYQVNYEVKTVSGKYYGMLSYALCRHYSKIRNQDNAQVQQLIQRFIDQYNFGSPQVHTLTGDINIQLSIFFNN